MKSAVPKSHEVAVRTIPASMMPDEKYQFLLNKPFALVFDPNKPLPVDREPVASDFVRPKFDEWFLYDSWSLDLACRLITLGYPVDLEKKREEAKGWPTDASGRDLLHTMLIVFCRAAGIAHASVAAGTIKDPDTPENWKVWAESKGYSVAHLGSRNPQTPTDHIKPLSRLAAQENAIIEEIGHRNLNPLALPKPPAGKSGVKAEIRRDLCKRLQDTFCSTDVFNDAWQRLRDQKRIVDRPA